MLSNNGKKHVSEFSITNLKSKKNYIKIDKIALRKK